MLIMVQEDFSYTYHLLELPRIQDIPEKACPVMIKHRKVLYQVAVYHIAMVFHTSLVSRLVAVLEPIEDMEDLNAIAGSMKSPKFMWRKDTSGLQGGR